MDGIVENIPENPEDSDVNRRHPCSKLFVRTVTVITCIHMIIHRRVTPLQDDLIRCRTLSFIRTCPSNPEMDKFADPDTADLWNFVIRWVMFGSFPMLSLAAMLISGPMMGRWPRLIERVFVNPTLMHVFCLFSLFYMFLESLFRSFAFIYGISSVEHGTVTPWGEYLIASLYSILLWFFFLNFLVNMQLTEFDCRTAREIAGGIGDEQNLVPNDQE
ncbi:hypothetical protein RB195_005046 [Necator americanus]|uniref:Uncharacterized protein n=1 Tax=Necator americanus TaxID=51031 RepID=A0ABR1BQ43_NECAM